MLTVEKPDRNRAAIQVRDSALRQHGNKSDDSLPEDVQIHEEVQQGERYRGREGRERRVSI